MKFHLKQIAVMLFGLMTLTVSSCSIFDVVSKSSSSSSSSSFSHVEPTGDGYYQGSLNKKLSDVKSLNGEFDFPTTGDMKLLVIPVEIKGYESVATDTNKGKIEKSFFGSDSETSWESLSSFYYKSSFGKLNITGTVTDWYDCGYTTSQIVNLTSSTAYFDQTWVIVDNAVSWYKSTYNTKATEFDNDKNGFIDGVWLVYGSPDFTYFTNPSANFKDVFWAFTYSEYSNRTKYNYNSPVAYRYCWASYDFLFDGYGDSGIDAHTWIHETGHMLGLDDYYVASSEDYPTIKNVNPLGSIDMMDNNIIDHNTFSKMLLGWIDDPLVANGSGTFTLKAANADSGHCLIVPTSKDWNGMVFDEYMLVEYYTPDGLNKKDSDSAYPGNNLRGFTEKGVRIFHIDARLALTNGSSSSYTNEIKATASQLSVVAHSNSKDYNWLNPSYRLIQAIDCDNKRNFDTDTSGGRPYKATDSSLFGEGDVFSFSKYQHSFPEYYYNQNSTMNNGGTLPYTISFSDMTSSSVNITLSAA